MYFVIFLYDFGGCEYNLSSDFSFFLLFIGYGGGYAPKLLSFLEYIPDIYKISGGHNENLIVAKVDDFGVIIGWLDFFKVLVDVRVEGFL